MPRIQHIGRPSLHFYGKYLSEISRNLKNFGVGRVVVKEKELTDFKETCFYTLTKVEPFMADEEGLRCRAWGHRIFRGKDMGEVIIQGSYQPDWRLLGTDEATRLVAAPRVTADVTQISCLVRFPHLVEASLIKTLPHQFSADKPPLMLLRPNEVDCEFAEPSPLTPEEVARVWPPFDTQVKEEGGRVRSTPSRDSYYIRRTDHPGILWKVELKPESDTL